MRQYFMRRLWGKPPYGYNKTHIARRAGFPNPAANRDVREDSESLKTILSLRGSAHTAVAISTESADNLRFPRPAGSE
jgi:hypothetical protein